VRSQALHRTERQNSGRRSQASCAPNEQDAAALSRFNADGSVDTSFGGGTGTVTANFGNTEYRALGSNFGPNGEFYVTGEFLTSEGYIPEFGSIPSSDFAVARYNANGSLDASFGSNGLVTTAVSPHADYAETATTQADGKVIVGGVAAGSSAIVRYNANGSLDTSFSGDGIALAADPYTQASAIVFALTIQIDGKIVGAGDRGHQTFLVRYNPDGTPDSSFGGGDGVAFSEPEADFPSSGFESGTENYAVAVEPSGRIVVAGGLYSYWEDTFSQFLSRFNPNGALDHSFGTGGYASMPSGNAGDLRAMLLQSSEGKILAAGGTGNPGYDFTVSRYEGGGGPIPTYHRLTVAETGAGHIYGTGITCGPECGSDFVAGETAILEAFPEEGATFQGWSGACSGTSPTCEVTMDSDKSVSAEFSGSQEQHHEEEHHEEHKEEHHETSGGGGGSGGQPPTDEHNQPSKPKKPLKCHKGFEKKMFKGKAKCVKKPRKKSKKHLGRH
jgi:uncharacterized delta-60 repeat protein